MGIVIPLLVAGKLQANKQIDKRVQGAEGAKKKRTACEREEGKEARKQEVVEVMRGRPIEEGK